MWNAADDLWVPDPGAPIGFEGNLVDIAFDPADPDRGYAVGKGGVLALLRQELGDPTRRRPGSPSANFTSIAFAGGEAIVAAGGDLLVNDGGGWRVDPSAHALLDGVRGGDPQLYAVAGLPDGGAVAAGRDIVNRARRLRRSLALLRSADPGLHRDRRRRGAGRRSVSGPISFGGAEALLPASPTTCPNADPNVPPPIVPPFSLPGDGYLLRENAAGWVDEGAHRLRHLGQRHPR